MRNPKKRIQVTIKAPIWVASLLGSFLIRVP